MSSQTRACWIFRACLHPGIRDEFERMDRKMSIPLVESHKGRTVRYSDNPVGGNPDELIKLIMLSV